MKHPIIRVITSIVLVIIVLVCLCKLFSLISSDIETIQDTNYAKAYIYATITIGGVVSLLLLNTKLK